MLVFLFPGWVCSEVLAQSGIENISRDVSGRIDQKIAKSNSKSEPAVKDLLAKPLTADSAVQIALWNNKSLQVILESWGITKADFNKTRLPENPQFAASIRFPQNKEQSNNVEFSIEQDFLSLILFPLKSNLAGAELHKAELEITKEALDLAFEVKTAFYMAEASQEMFSMRKKVLVSAEASNELVERQFKAGNINELELSNNRTVYQDAKLGYMKSEAEFIQAKENLNRLMGFGGEEPSWEIKDNLEEIQAAEPSLEELQSMAVSKRLDLAIAKKELEIKKHAISVERFGVLGHPEVGIDTEKDVSGERVTGPTVRTDVPLYDLGQTDISRAGAELKSAEYRFDALLNDVRSDIKMKRDRLFSIRQMAEEYKNSIIPVRTKVVEETQKHYNFMLLDVFHLIQAKQNEVIAQKEYTETLRDYWIARSDLEKAVSSKLLPSHQHRGGHNE